MDTIETQEPTGVEDVAPSEDTSSTDTQTVEPSEPSAGNGEETVASENLLAGKYKSPEALESAYKELEGKLGELGQKAKVADLIQEKYGMTPEQLQETIEAQEQAELEKEYQTNPAGFALREVQELKGQLALKEIEAERDAYIRENPEMEPFKDKLLNLYLNVEKDKSLAEIGSEYFGQAIAKGQQDAYKRIEVKQKTQATGVSSVPKRQIGIEDMKNMSVAELEAILPHADISNRAVR